MGDLTKICRVCGRTYEACRSAAKRKGVFHWQEVACSPECGQVYLERIMRSRMKQPNNVIPQAEDDNDTPEEDDEDE